MTINNNNNNDSNNKLTEENQNHTTQQPSQTNTTQQPSQTNTTQQPSQTNTTQQPSQNNTIKPSQSYAPQQQPHPHPSQSQNRPPQATRMPPAFELQQLRQKNQRLELALEISRQFSSTLDVDTLMQTILDKVVHVLNAEAGSFWLSETTSNTAVCHAAVGPAKDKVLGLKLKPGTGIVGWVIENKQKTVVFDTSMDDRFFSKVDEKVNFVTKSMLCVPLLVNQKCVGAISLINKKTPLGQFNQQDVEMLELLAMSGAISIKNAQLFQSERKIKELKTLLNISKEINSTLDLDRVLLAIVNLGTQVVQYSRAVIGLLDMNNKIILSAETNVAQPDLTEANNKSISTLMKTVLTNNKPIHIGNFNPDTPPKDTPQHVIDYLVNNNLNCLSIIVMADSEGPLGVISMEGTANMLVPKDSLYILDIVVNQATVAIRNAQLYKNIPLHTLSGKLKTGMKKSTRSWRKYAILICSFIFILIIMNVFTITEKVTTVVEIIPSHITQVTALTDGVVQDVLFNEGDQIQKNQTIIVLDQSLLTLEKARLNKDININIGELRRLQSDGAPYEVYLKKLEIEKQQNQLEFINKQISFTHIVSTANGRILTQKPKELVNKQVIKGEVLTEIAVNDEKMAEVILLENDVLKVQMNHNAIVTLQAFPDIVINGTVHQISWSMTEPETEDKPKGYKAWIKSDDINALSDIRFGMTGKAKIIIGPKTPFEIFVKPICDSVMTWVRLKLESGDNKDQ